MRLTGTDNSVALPLNLEPVNLSSSVGLLRTRHPTGVRSSTGQVRDFLSGVFSLSARSLPPKRRSSLGVESVVGTPLYDDRILFSLLLGESYSVVIDPSFPFTGRDGGRCMTNG